MPALLVSNNHQPLNDNEKGTFVSSTIDTSDLERQVARGSVEAAYQLATVQEYQHDDTRGNCFNCDKVANYYLLALRLAKNNSHPLQCNPLLLSVVQGTIQLVHRHINASRTQHLPWLPILMSELRDLNKQIKDSSPESDRCVPLSSLNLLGEEDVSDTSMDSSVNGEYGRAIRIAIYHCRATLCEDLDTIKAISYYRKCVSVRSSPVESLKLQENARLSLQYLIAEKEELINTARPKLPSRTASVSSGASSSSSMACSNCGVEKRGLPVCSKCKSQYYCGINCLKSHKPIHDLECGKSHH